MDPEPVPISEQYSCHVRWKLFSRKSR